MDIKQYLKQKQVPFEVLRHERSETAAGTAKELDVSEDNFAKTVVLLVDGRPVIAVLQAPYLVNPAEVKNALGAGVAALADEADFEEYFPDCERGAVPPFGSQYGMPTVVDTHLAEDDYIVFDGNTHREAIMMRFEDYQTIEHPHQAAIRDTSYA
jgi:Ala-tRNA(Pro) deacylase